MINICQIRIRLCIINTLRLYYQNSLKFGNSQICICVLAPNCLSVGSLTEFMSDLTVIIPLGRDCFFQTPLSNGSHWLHIVSDPIDIVAVGDFSWNFVLNM